MTDIYIFDEITYEYLSQSVAEVDADFNDIIPYNATTIAPMAAAPNKQRVFNRISQTWSEVDDYRGELWYLKADGSLVIFNLGDVPNLTTMTNIPKPSTNPELFVWDEGTTSWIYDLVATRAYQKRKVATAANANLTSLLDDGLNTILDVVAFTFARIDGDKYKAIIPNPLDYTFTTNVALSGSAPLIQDGNDLTGINNATCKLTGQTTADDNGYYNYVKSGANYTLTKITEPETPFYDGVKYESSGSKLSSHEDWDGTSFGAAGYLGIFSERKRMLMVDIDAATTGPDILALNWINM